MRRVLLRVESARIHCRKQRGGPENMSSVFLEGAPKLSATRRGGNSTAPYPATASPAPFVAVVKKRHISPAALGSLRASTNATSAFCAAVTASTSRRAVRQWVPQRRQRGHHRVAPRLGSHHEHVHRPSDASTFP